MVQSSAQKPQHQDFYAQTPPLILHDPVIFVKTFLCEKLQLEKNNANITTTHIFYL